MPRLINRLSAQTVERKRKSGYHADGGGLYLQISKSGSKSWIFRYTLNGKSREMGLGSLQNISLKKARTKATSYRQQLENKVDPIETRDKEFAEQRATEAKSQTFDDCAKAYIAAHSPGWKNEKHANQWENTLSTYVSPVFGDLPASTIDTTLVMKAIEPIWSTKTETASRVRGRIESVLDWAAVRGYRTGENPARWRGHLDKLLPKRSKVAAVKHHPALEYEKVGKFINKLRKQTGYSPLALEFLILTASRVSEVVNAEWKEIDLKSKIWTVPGERMKAGREHRVPLSARAIEILRELKAAKQNDYVFPGWKADSPLSTGACPKLLKDMGFNDITVHGFRSTFRDWTAEQTNYPREVAEAALAHTIEDKVEAAYRRGDLFKRRAKMMDAWAKHCGTEVKSATVTPIRKKRA